MITPETLIRLHDQVINQQVFIQPGYLHSLRTGLRQLYMSGTSPDISNFLLLFGGGNDGQRVTVKNGIARIPILGPIYNDDPEDYLVKAGYISSYKAIREDYQACKDNEDVKCVVFDIESPGGIGGPLLDIMEEIYESREILPTVAYIENYGFSAAQGIAAACNEIWIARGAHCGSVGSIIIHEDITESLKMDGITVETFTYGKKKDQGASFKPLSDEARAEYKERVSKHGKEFTELTAKILGKGFESIKALEAGVFSGTDAIDVGLAHRIVPGHTVQAEVEKKFLSTKTKRNKGVGSKMDLQKLKDESLDEYKDLMAEAKAELEDSKDLSGEDTKAKDELAMKVASLETIVEKQGKVIESQTTEIKEHAKLEAIRSAKAIKAKADVILIKALTDKDCAIPVSLHSKVEVDHINFLKEDGGLDTEAYITAVGTEIKDWEAKLAKDEDSDIQGIGSGGEEVVADSSDEDTLAAINTLRIAGGLEPKAA